MKIWRCKMWRCNDNVWSQLPFSEESYAQALSGIHMPLGSWASDPFSTVQAKASVFALLGLWNKLLKREIKAQATLTIPNRPTQALRSEAIARPEDPGQRLQRPIAMPGLHKWSRGNPQPRCSGPHCEAPARLGQECRIYTQVWGQIQSIWVASSSEH